MVHSVETVGPLDRQRMGLSVEHPEVETQELGVTVEEVQVLEGLRQEEGLLDIVVLWPLPEDSLHS